MVGENKIKFSLKLFAGYVGEGRSPGSEALRRADPGVTCREPPAHDRGRARSSRAACGGRDVRRFSRGARELRVELASRPGLLAAARSTSAHLAASLRTQEPGTEAKRFPEPRDLTPPW